MPRIKQSVSRSIKGRAPQKELANKSVRSVEAGIRGVKKTRCIQLGKKIIDEIRECQHSTELLIPKASFRREVRKVCQEYKADLCFQSDAMEALQQASEAYLVEIFDLSQMVAYHSGRITIRPGDIQLVRRIRGERS